MEVNHYKMEDPQRSMKVHHPNSRGHTKVWVSVGPTQGAKPKLWSPRREGQH